MAEIPLSELKTQDRVIDLFTSKAVPERLSYRCFSDWNKREKPNF